MLIIPSVGHVGVKIGGVQYALIPSLYAMSKLLDPVSDYAALHTGDVDTAHRVIIACSNCPSISDYLGMRQVGKTRAVIKDGAITRTTKQYTHTYIDDKRALIIAASLLHHGLIGHVVESKTRVIKDDDYTSVFDPLEYATMATVHLGLTSEQAWGLTMTQLRRALGMKFPPSEKQTVQDELLDEYDKLSEWREQLQKVRG